MDLEKIREYLETKGGGGFDPVAVLERRLADPRNPGYELVVLYHTARDPGREPSTPPATSPPPQLALLSAPDAVHVPRFVVSASRFAHVRGQILLVADTPRSVVTAEDLAAASAFCRGARYSMFSNAAGSGARVEDQVHFQGFPCTFPAAMARAKVIGRWGDVAIGWHDHPCRGIVFSGRPDAVAQAALKFADATGRPVNLLLWADTVKVVPRALAVPPGFEPWDFGGAELAGLYFTRSRDQWSSLTVAGLLRACAGVAVPPRATLDTLNHMGWGFAFRTEELDDHAGNA
jgi:hypothetical protein